MKRIVRKYLSFLFRSHLNDPAFSLLCVCLAILLTYNLSLLLMLYSDRLDTFSLARHFDILCESEALAILSTVCGTALFECEIRHSKKK